MKHGIQTCQHPNDPKKLYMRNLFHEFFWGPFDGEEELIKAVQTLDRANPFWDYEPFCIVYGADPLPADYVYGFTSAPKELWDRINSNRAKEKAL